VLTPEEIIFRTNSDTKSIIIITPNNIYYAFEGSYGGYVVKPPIPDVELRDARAFFVEPRIDGASLDDVRDAISRYLDELPEEVRKEFEDPSKAEIIRYRFVEVELKVVKSNDRYMVLDFEPKPNGLKLEAEAVRLKIHYEGSRKYPESTTATKIVREWKLKYPDSEVLQKYVYAKSYTGYRGRGSTIYLKVVTKAPKELLPVAPSTAKTSKEIKPVAIKGFLVISRLPSKALLDASLPEIFKDIKIGKKEIKLVMGYFYNKLGTLSRKFYTTILPSHAINVGFGYIVPKERVPSFLRDVDLLKREYEEFEKQLKDFLLHGKVPPEIQANKRAKVYKEYLDVVMEYLKKYGAEEKVRKKIESLNIAGRVRIDLLPFSIDYSIVEDFIDDRVKARVSKEIERLTREVVEAARKRIEAKVKNLLERVERLGIEKLTREAVNALRKELEGIIREAEEFGINAEPLRRLTDTLESPEEFARATMEVRAKSERLKALIKSMM